MDVAETVAQLKAAQETAKALSDAASQQQALPLKANAAQERFVKAIDPQQEGKFTGSVGGQEAKKAQAGRRELGEPTERFAQPFILSEAPGDIGLASPASTLLFAGANLHATVQQDLHIASAHTVSTAAGNGASWFSHSGGIKSIAQAGTQTIQANTDQMEILADQSITITSSNDEIHILAKEKIVLQAGQSSVTLEGDNITFACPGKFSVKGSGSAFLGPGSSPAQSEALPDSRVKMFDETFRAVDKVSGMPIANQPYRIETMQGDVFEGVTDDQGRTSRIPTTDPQSVKLYWTNITEETAWPDDSPETDC